MFDVFLLLVYIFITDNVVEQKLCFCIIIIIIIYIKTVRQFLGNMTSCVFLRGKIKIKKRGLVREGVFIAART